MFRRYPLTFTVALLVTTTFAGAQEPQTCETGFRLFDHELLAGEPVCIPENPQRVVALDMAAVETVLYTGKDLLGTNTWIAEELPVMLPKLASELEGVEALGYPSNLETVLLLKPDLILATDDAIDVEAAAEIAPVVVGTSSVYLNWEDGVSLWSAVLGVPDLYDELTASYDARISELQEALGEARAETEVSIVSASTYGASLWLIDTAPGKVVSDVGFARPEAQNFSGEAGKAEYEDAPYVAISDERLDLADGDEIFVFNYATADPELLQKENAATEAFRDDPLWQGLSGVQAGRAYYVGGHWWRAQTYMLVNRVIDDLFTYLVGEPGTTPVLSFEEVSQ